MKGVSIWSVEAALAEITGFGGAVGAAMVGGGGGKTTAGFTIGAEAGAGSILTGSVNLETEVGAPAGLNVGNGGGTEAGSTVGGFGGGSTALEGMGADLLVVGTGLFATGGVDAAREALRSLNAEARGVVVVGVCIGLALTGVRSDPCRFNMCTLPV
jgi:hypothetical protein